MTTAIVLAAGRSRRMRTSVPKVLHQVAGKPLLVHALDALAGVRQVERIVVVVPPGGQVETALQGRAHITFAVQKEALGTGDAARVGLKAAGGADTVLILPGDSPLMRSKTLSRLLAERRRSKAPVAVLTAVLDDPAAYGRVLRDEGGRVTRIVEARDATPAEAKIDEVATSVYAFDRAALAKALPKLKRSNAQGEYYLTDVVAMVGGALGVVGPADEVLGSNTRADLVACTRVLRERAIDRLLEAGVTIVDPDTTYVDAGVVVGADTILRPGTHLEGATRIGRGCDIGPDVRLVDTQVGDEASVTYAVARSSKIGPGATVGPFASLRAGTVLKRGAKVGTFVETKAAEIGEGAKVPHLSYLGDITVGKRANIGAGTITCNYDGKRKHRTEVGDDTFIGTDNSLIAPVKIGRRAYTGAGSLVNRDVPDGGFVYGVPAKPRTRKKETS